MKLIKTTSGKQQIKVSKSEWEGIGKTAGWMKAETVSRIKTAQNWLPEQDMEDPNWITNQLKVFTVNPENFWKNVRFYMNEPTLKAKDRKQVLKDLLNKLKKTSPNLDMFSKSEKSKFTKALMALAQEEIKDAKEEELLDKLRNADEVPEHLKGNKETIEGLPVAVQEMEEATPKAERAETVTTEIDSPEFATKKQIEEIKDSLIDRYTKGEITEDQLKMMLREFAKKNNMVIKVAKSNGKIQIKISKS
jgi:hypothetical protein